MNAAPTISAAIVCDLLVSGLNGSNSEPHSTKEPCPISWRSIVHVEEAKRSQSGLEEGLFESGGLPLDGSVMPS